MTNLDESPAESVPLNNILALKPKYASSEFVNPDAVNVLITQLNLEEHREGGYFKETDRSPYKIANPYKTSGAERNYSTLIYYLIAPKIPIGRFHKNQSRIIHILQQGSGMYVLIYPDGKVRSFKVGFDFAKGEVAQWVVPGGVWKASFIADGDSHLLISEIVVPGFEYDDHEFLKVEELERLVGSEGVQALSWLCSGSC